MYNQARSFEIFFLLSQKETKEFKRKKEKGKKEQRKKGKKEQEKKERRKEEKRKKLSYLSRNVALGPVHGGEAQIVLLNQGRV